MLLRSLNIISREIYNPILNNKEKHVLDIIDTKTWKVAFLESVKMFIESSDYNLLQIHIPMFSHYLDLSYHHNTLCKIYNHVLIAGLVHMHKRSYIVPSNVGFLKRSRVGHSRDSSLQILKTVVEEVINETPEMPLTKKKEKDIHKTHPSGSGTITKTAPSVAKIKPFAISEGTSVKPGVLDVAEEESSENEAESQGNDKYDSNNEQVSSDEDSDQEKDNDDDKTQSDNEYESDSEHETDESESGSESNQDKSKENEEDDDDEDETKITDKVKGDEDEEMDYTTSQLYDDVDIRLNEPIDTNKGFVQEEGSNAAMTNVQQGNENPEILQVIEDAYATLSTVPQKTEVLVTSSSLSSDLVTKFLNFSDIPHPDAEIISLLDVHVHHEELPAMIRFCPLCR
nr:hypothetical protein [Tanacetum cinerariifolium]